MNATENIESPFHAPFFSVVVTSYNREKLIPRALQSLIQQSEKDWEAIIVDDGSTDNTSAVIEPFLQKGYKITYFRQESKGCAEAKNTGIFLSQGKYITFLDSDDEYTPDHLAKRKAILSENTHIDLLHGGVKIIGSAYVPDRFNTEKMIHLKDCVIGGTFFVERNLALQLKGFGPIPLGHDADFFEKARQLGVLIIKTEYPTYIYHREAPDSLTHAYTVKNKVS
ncbi:MAG: glycosyltransferase family 2 protein [Chitinophagaceae bacterium]|nr:glycosyltransferase family 2 protein [Chitinophagaceae bacterium]